MGWTQTLHPSAPIFVADWNSIDRNTGRQVDWSQVPASYIAGSNYTITTTAVEPIGETTVAVVALPVALPIGTILDFGAGKFAELTAPAAAGATTITVEALAVALASGDAATYTISHSQNKVLPAGIAVSQLAGGKIVPRAVSAGEGAAGAIGLLLTAAEENSKSDSLSGYGIVVGGVIYENLLPESITAYKTELETNGMSWVWAVYADNTEV